MKLICVTVLCCFSCAALAQEPKPVKTTVEGCVTRSEAVPGALVLTWKDQCMRLTGKAFKADEIAGHTVNFDGVWRDATEQKPESLEVLGVKHVGGVCSETCTLVPPGGRGTDLGGRKKEVPAGPASTPGIGAPPQPE